MAEEATITAKVADEVVTEKSNGHRNDDHGRGRSNDGSSGSNCNNNDNDKKVKMFEPHNVRKQPTDMHSRALEEILITITKCNDGGQIAEQIGGNDCKVMNGEPTAPGSLAVDPHQKDDRGDCVEDEKEKRSQ